MLFRSRPLTSSARKQTVVIQCVTRTSAVWRGVSAARANARLWTAAEPVMPRMVACAAQVGARRMLQMQAAEKARLEGSWHWCLERGTVDDQKTGAIWLMRV